MMKLKRHEQALLFQFLVTRTKLPGWAKKDIRIAFARLMNRSPQWGKDAYAEAVANGWMTK